VKTVLSIMLVVAVAVIASGNNGCSKEHEHHGDTTIIVADDGSTQIVYVNSSSNDETQMSTGGTSNQDGTKTPGMLNIISEPARIYRMPGMIPTDLYAFPSGCVMERAEMGGDVVWLDAGTWSL